MGVKQPSTAPRTRTLPSSPDFITATVRSTWPVIGAPIWMTPTDSGKCQNGWRDSKSPVTLIIHLMCVKFLIILHRKKNIEWFFSYHRLNNTWFYACEISMLFLFSHIFYCFTCMPALHYLNDENWKYWYLIDVTFRSNPTKPNFFNTSNSWKWNGKPIFTTHTK